VSIYKRKSGKYTVVLAQSEGSTKRRSLGTFNTKKEAEEAERRALIRRNDGIDLAPQTTTLADVYNAFMDEAEGDGLSGTTLRNYRETFRRCETIASVPIVKLRPTHIARLRAALLNSGWSGGNGPLSPRSVRNTVSFVVTLLAWAVDNELVARNVAAVTRLRRDRRKGPSVEKKPTRHYERDEALRLISAAANTRHAPMIVFAFETGLRRGELAGLRWDDVNFERRIATIRSAVAQVPGNIWLKSTKTKLVADLPLSEHAVEALRTQRVQQAKDKLRAGELYDDQGFVFAPEQGGMPTPSAISSAVAKIAKRAKLPLRTVHGMRHSVGSWLLNAGVDIETTRAILRHSSASTTLNVYAHELRGAKAAAVGNLLGASVPTGTEGKN
jgi:integrase